MIDESKRTSKRVRRRARKELSDRTGRQRLALGTDNLGLDVGSEDACGASVDVLGVRGVEKGDDCDGS